MSDSKKKPRTCPSCGGRGTNRLPIKDDGYGTEVQCTTCGGSGRVS